MSQVWSDAESVQALAEGLIGSHHPELATAKMRYIFKEKASAKGGKKIYGSVKKVSEEGKFLTEGNPDFIMTIALETWVELDSSKRSALVDHLLERCTGEADDQGEMKWTTRDPDVHEFASILSRHGAWTEQLEGFASVAKTLDEAIPDVQERVTTRQS